jgi:ubiquitin conjugation factor E4 B
VGSKPSAPPPAKRVHVKEEPIEEWSNRVLSEVLRVTLDQTRAGPKMTYLPNMADELREAGEPLKLNAQNVDTAILEAASSLPADKPLLDYLLPCFKRVVRTTITGRRLSSEQTAVLEEAKRLCLSNCVFALSMPEYFS